MLFYTFEGNQKAIDIFLAEPSKYARIYLKTIYLIN